MPLDRQAALAQLQQRAVELLPEPQRALIKRLLLQAFIEHTVVLRPDGSFSFLAADLAGMGGHLDTACRRHADPAAARSSFEAHGRKLKRVLSGMEALVEVVADEKGHMSLGRLNAAVLRPLVHAVTLSLASAASAAPGGSPAAAAAAATAAAAAASAMAPAPAPAAARAGPAPVPTPTPTPALAPAPAAARAGRAPAPAAAPAAAAAAAAASRGLQVPPPLPVATVLPPPPSRPPPGMRSVLGVDCCLVSSLEAAREAVHWLQRSGAVALDTEGDLARQGSLDVMQLFAAGRAYLFDLHAMPPAARADALGLLRPLLEDPRTAKVMHDCRADCEALFYLHGIHMQGVWDTQVAQAVLGAIAGMAGSKGSYAPQTRVGMDALLASQGLATNPHKTVVKKRMAAASGLWRGPRPLELQLLEYAVGDVRSLLDLRARLQRLLGEVGCEAVERLSRAHTEWGLDDGDRSYAVGGARSYAAAAKLPMGVDMQLLIEPPDYRPRFVVALSPDAPPAAGQLSSAAAQQHPGAAPADDAQPRISTNGQHRGAENTAGNATPSKLVPALGRLGFGDGGSASGGGCQLPGGKEGAPETVGGSSSSSKVPGSLSSLLSELFPGSRQAAAGAAEPAAAGPAHGQPAAGGAPAAAPAAGPAQLPLVAASPTPGLQPPAVDAEASCILSLFPEPIRRDILQACRSGGDGQQQRRQLVEICTDKGRRVVVRFGGDGGEQDLDCELDIEEALELLRASKQRLRLGDRWTDELFFSDNRTGIPGTLHRISAIRGRDGRVLGLTYRIGRHVSGVSLLIMDILAGLSVSHPGTAAWRQRQLEAAAASQAAGPQDGGGSSSGSGESGERRPEEDFVSPSLLLLGPPGVGKTTLLRDVAGVLADKFSVLVVDEIGTAKEVAAAKSIAQRGVVMVGTAHGVTLESLLKNPELNPLVGGVHQVLLGDREAAASNAGMKTRAERRGAPCFSTLCEVLAPNMWRIHPSVAASVDAILQGRRPSTQLRWVAPDGRLMVRAEGDVAAAAAPAGGLARQAAAKGGEAWLLDLINLASLY